METDNTCPPSTLRIRGTWALGGGTLNCSQTRSNVVTSGIWEECLWEPDGWWGKLRERSRPEDVTLDVTLP